MFVVGTDAPSSIPSIVGVPIQIETIVLTNGSTMSNNLLAAATTVDFARYNGLQGFVDMNDVQPGTYTGVTITLGTASINYLSPGTPPTINNETATLSTSSVSITLPHSLTVSQTGGVPVGLRIDLDLRQSIETSGGVPTGTIDPTFDVSAVARTDTWAHIDEFVGSVTTLPSTSGTPPTAAEPNSFVITGPHGEAFTINTTSSTEWDGGATLASLNSTSIVAVAGQFDPADQTLDADEVALISDTGFYAGGLVTYVTPILRSSHRHAVLCTRHIAVREHECSAGRSCFGRHHRQRKLRHLLDAQRIHELLFNCRRADARPGDHGGRTRSYRKSRLM